MQAFTVRHQEFQEYTQLGPSNSLGIHPSSSFFLEKKSSLFSVLDDVSTFTLFLWFCPNRWNKCVTRASWGRRCRGLASRHHRFQNRSNNMSLKFDTEHRHFFVYEKIKLVSAHLGSFSITKWVTNTSSCFVYKVFSSQDLLCDDHVCVVFSNNGLQILMSNVSRKWGITWVSERVKK